MLRGQGTVLLFNEWKVFICADVYGIWVMQMSCGGNGMLVEVLVKLVPLLCLLLRGQAEGTCCTALSPSFSCALVLAQQASCLLHSAPLITLAFCLPSHWFLRTQAVRQASTFLFAHAPLPLPACRYRSVTCVCAGVNGFVQGRVYVYRKMHGCGLKNPDIMNYTPAANSATENGPNKGRGQEVLFHHSAQRGPSLWLRFIISIQSSQRKHFNKG